MSNVPKFDTRILPFFKNSKVSGKGAVIDWVNESLSATVYVGCELRTIRCQIFLQDVS